MTTKEKIDLMVWCQQAVIAAQMSEAALQNEQLKIFREGMKNWL